MFWYPLLLNASVRQIYNIYQILSTGCTLNCDVLRILSERVSFVLKNVGQISSLSLISLSNSVYTPRSVSLSATRAADTTDHMVEKMILQSTTTSYNQTVMLGTKRERVQCSD